MHHFTLILSKSKPNACTYVQFRRKSLSFCDSHLKRKLSSRAPPFLPRSAVLQPDSPNTGPEPPELHDCLSGCSAARRTVRRGCTESDGYLHRAILRQRLCEPPGKSGGRVTSQHNRGRAPLLHFHRDGRRLLLRCQGRYTHRDSQYGAKNLQSVRNHGHFIVRMLAQGRHTSKPKKSTGCHHRQQRRAECQSSQPCGLPFSFHYRRNGGNFTICAVDNFARAAGENFAARQGNFTGTSHPPLPRQSQL